MSVCYSLEGGREYSRLLAAMTSKCLVFQELVSGERRLKADGGRWCARSLLVD
jgi:hypothetical protein